MLCDLDNLVVGQQWPADPERGIPAGEVTSVTRVPCADHDPEEGGTGWLRLCYYCSVRWTESYSDGRSGDSALRNGVLWTDDDRAALDAERAEHDQAVAAPAEPFDPWAMS